MCCWMLWGGVEYFLAECPSGAGAPLEVVQDWAQCNAWLAWVVLNAAFHLFWVTVLTCCQLYLVRFSRVRSSRRLGRERSERRPSRFRWCASA